MQHPNFHALAISIDASCSDHLYHPSLHIQILSELVFAPWKSSAKSGKPRRPQDWLTV